MSWADPALDPAERARALMDEAARCTRGGLKRLAAEVQRSADEGLVAALVAEGRARGAELPDEALQWPAKRLLRLARAREDESRLRSNPVHRDEAFTCAHCGHAVPPQGRTARDHCPRCLRSLHVDVVPGDRASGCGGVLDPVSVQLRHGEALVRYRCRRCGHEGVNRALLDGEDPDDWAVISALSAGEVV